MKCRILTVIAVVSGLVRASSGNAAPALVSTSVDFDRIYRVAEFCYANAEGKAEAAGSEWRLYFVDVEFFEIDDVELRYVIADDVAKEAKIIAIRGTANLTNMILDARFDLVAHPRIEAKIHRGFLDGAEAVFADVLPRLTPGSRVITAGHSLGGAVAVIVSKLLLFEGFEVVETITFGQPMITDLDGVSPFLDVPLLRVVDGYDAVPRLPYESTDQGNDIGYVHFGPELLMLGTNRYSCMDPTVAGVTYSRRYWEVWSREKLYGVFLDHQMESYLARLRKLRVESVRVDFAEYTGGIFDALMREAVP